MDASGQKDTIVIGADPNATTGIDEAFGEQNIKQQSYIAGKFEVRISDFYLGMAEWTIPFVNPDLTTFHTKKQIMPKDCSWYYPIYAMIPAILVYHAQYPLTVSWDTDPAYQEDCFSKSLITNWGPGGWWDAVHGGEQLPFYLAEYDSAVFNQIVYKIKNGENSADTLDLLFFTIAHDTVFILDLPEDYVNKELVMIYPNPASGEFRILIDRKLFLPDDLLIFDLHGRRMNFCVYNSSIDISHLPSGHYTVFFNYNERLIRKRLIKTH